MGIIHTLFDIEHELPKLLLDATNWQSVFIDYEKPHVERLWMPWNENRINLHRIHPCGDHEALFHPHPWPSAMKLVSGQYKMAIGYGSGITHPVIATTLLLPAGSYYEMAEPDAWHYVRPLLTASLSVMLTGPRWIRDVVPVTKKLQPLNPMIKHDLIKLFRAYYPTPGSSSDDK